MTEGFELPELNDQDSIAVQLSAMTNGLRHPADDGFNDDYCRIRAILRRHPFLKNRLPQFLVESNTVADYRNWMTEHCKEPFEWDALLQNSMSKLIEHATSGDTLSNYVNRGERARGGFGRIFIAEHQLTNRLFAIKFYQPIFHDGGGTPLSRFFQEASMLYELDHTNIITVRDVGLHKERPFIVMDYFEGSTLNEALIAQGKMPPTKAIEMVEMVASALNHAHEKGIVHRDLTPSNVLLAPNDCRVIDFGLGVYVEQALTSRLTRQGDTAAGGNFTARELLANPKLIDSRSDIYSIGALWYNAVTNDLPTGANVPDSLQATDGLSSSNQDVILKCLSDIDQRYQTCGELLEAIASLKTENQS